MSCRCTVSAAPSGSSASPSTPWPRRPSASRCPVAMSEPSTATAVLDPRDLREQRRLANFTRHIDPAAGPTGLDLGECWLWTAAVTPKGGYGQFEDGRTRRAHRVSYELFE